MSLYKKYKIIKKVVETETVVSLYLEPVEKTPLENFKPGQHLMFKVGFPGDDVHHFRFYSFSEAYNDQYYRVSVKREDSPAKGIPPGKCSTFLFNEIKEGQVLEAKGPSGDFHINPQEKDPVVLVAGGIGITPLLSMIKTISRKNPKRKIYFFYGVNCKEEHAFQEELDELNKKNLNLHITTFYANVRSTDVEGIDYDYEGFINLKKIAEIVPDLQVEYYICGPSAMMDYVSAGLEDHGVKKENLHFESFVGKFESFKSSGEGVEDEKRGLVKENKEGGFQIEFSKSRKKLGWNAKYDSLLEFAEDHDIEIPSGCLFGDCGTCLTRIKSGKVKYKHPTLVEPGAGECLPCSSVPLSDIVLEV